MPCVFCGGTKDSTLSTNAQVDTCLNCIYTTTDSKYVLTARGAAHFLFKLMILHNGHAIRTIQDLLTQIPIVTDLETCASGMLIDDETWRELKALD